MKKRLILGALAILGTAACIWIYMATNNLSCDQAIPVWQTHGPCFWRRLFAFWPFAIYLAAWTYLGGRVMKAKGRNPAIGWVVGFIFQFLGCLVLLMLDKKMTPEEKRLQAAREIMQGTYKPGRGKR